MGALSFETLSGDFPGSEPEMDAMGTKTTA